MTRAVIIAMLVPVLLADAARGDDAIPRYVAQQGDDRGDCSLPVRPCRTIPYALSVAGKGDQVRVARGTYALAEVLDAIEVVGSAVDVQGGFDRFDHFLRQAPATNRTTLTGVPVAFRDALQARGFQVVVDRKGLDAADRAALAGFQASRTSSAGADCIANSAGAYPCDNVDLLSHVALSDLSSKPGVAADIWGFVDLNTEREYALLGVENGLAVIDVSDPTAPFEVGTVPGSVSDWRDVKITQRYDDAAHRWRTYAYVSTEYGGRLVVVDLTELPNRVRLGRRSDTSAHNVYVSNVDYTTGVPLDESRTPPLLQVLGSAFNRGAFRSFDTSDPLNLVEVAVSPRGYSHDATSMLVVDDRTSACKTDTEACEVLLDFNESHIEIWDFSDQHAPKLLSSTTYENAGYVHSGWWTEDGRYLFVHDEFDESDADLDTTVRVFDLADLTDPRLVKVWTGPTAAIDHNGYVRGNRYFMSNYTRGLTILDITDPADPSAVGFFDTHPSSDNASFSGAWGAYPFLPSGNVLVSDFSGGLFVLADRTRSSEGVRIGFAARSFGGEEGDEVAVTVERTGSGGAVGVDYAVLVGSADSADIEAVTGTLHWPETSVDAEVSRSIAVPLLRDDLAEPIERAFVRLSNPTGGAVLTDVNMAYVFVGDAGRGPSVGFAATQMAVDETAGRLIATVRRLGSPLGAASVDFNVGSLTALPGADYVEVQPGRLSWTDGDATARTIVVPLVTDNEEEPRERFEIRLSSPTGATLGTDRILVDINGDGSAVTGFMLYDNATRQDLQPILDGKRLATHAVPGNTGIRVEVKKPNGVQSVGLTVDGAAETHTDNDAPYVFHILGDAPAGDYTLRATPYPENDLGGVAGEPLAVTFSVGDEPDVPSTDASLLQLELSGIDLRFDTDVASYEATVGPQVARTTVSASAAAGATYVIGPDDADAHTHGHQVDLAIGATAIDVAVTAEDGEATKTYTVAVFRAPFTTGP
ncbi:MAG: choice-of-anchor B family protein [Gammaproteobacteria bacterium]|nr:choice-of-anchor B family protein [Gammaproteobacteria bacterium]